MKDIILNDYTSDLKKIKETIRQNQNKAMVIVNSAMIMTYYEIGTIINKRKKWGNKYIQKLSEDLKSYGRGYSYSNIKYMAQFACEFSYEEISQQPVGQLAWGTMIIIMQKSKTHEEMIWYITHTHKYGWSRSQVLNRFKECAYEIGILEPNTTSIVKYDASLKEIFKDTYVFNFINKKTIKTEKDLTNSLVDNVVNFIQEMGSDFAFVEKEYKIITPTGKAFFIDILLYHLIQHAYVVIEIKSKKFKPSDLGQLLFYVNAINTLKKTNRDDETIGLILCIDSDNFVVENTLKSVNDRIGISKYKFIDDLTTYLTKRLKKE